MWDASWRAQLVDQLGILCLHLNEVGITDVYIDGSLVSEEASPNDIDGYYICECLRFIEEQRPQLIARDPAWNLRLRERDAKGRLKSLMWHRYRIGLFPQYAPPFVEFTLAAVLADGRSVPFSEFFRRSRAGHPRGVVRIIPERGPC